MPQGVELLPRAVCPDSRKRAAAGYLGQLARVPFEPVTEKHVVLAPQFDLQAAGEHSFRRCRRYS